MIKTCTLPLASVVWAAGFPVAAACVILIAICIAGLGAELRGRNKAS